MIMHTTFYSYIRLLLLIGFFLGISAASAASPARVLVLGDSISAAYGMSLDQGWVALMEEELNKQGATQAVINASISGETTAGALRRLPALLEEHQPTLVVVELGGNDGLRGHPIPSLRENLRDIVTSSQEAGARVLILPMEIPPNYGSRYLEAFRESFILISESTGASLGSFPLLDVATRPELMQADGIHPTVEAQPIIAERVLPEVLEALTQP